MGLSSPFNFISSNVWGAVKSLVLADDDFVYKEFLIILGTLST